MAVQVASLLRPPLEEQLLVQQLVCGCPAAAKCASQCMHTLKALLRHTLWINCRDMRVQGVLLILLTLLLQGCAEMERAR